MNPDDPGDLLDRIGVLRSRCDLDLLVFFARHPNCLLDSESLAAFLGYDLPDIAKSLGVLLTAELLQRTQASAHAARLYVFVTGGPLGGRLPALLWLASTRPGRLALRDALDARSPGAAGRAEPRGEEDGGEGRPAGAGRPAEIERRPGDQDR